MKKYLLACLLVLPLVGFAKGGAPMSVREVKCEQQINPLGVDTPSPRFSWQIAARERGFLQTAYQIIVSSSQEELERGVGSSWNSGRVSSDESVLIPYRGRKLQAMQRYYYRVRVWGAGKEPSPWSAVGHFGMGLLAETDWSGARWIALQADVDSLTCIMGEHTLAKGPEYVAPKNPYLLPEFRRAVQIDKPIARATAYVCGLGQFDFFVNGAKVGGHFMDPVWTQYDKNAQYVAFDLTQTLQPGANALGVMLGNGFFHIPHDRYTKFTASYGAPKMIAKLLVEYTDGTSQTVVSDASWRASRSPITFSSIFSGEDYDATMAQSGWSTASFDDTAWQMPVLTPFETRLSAQMAPPLAVMERIPTVRLFQSHTGRWVYDLGQNASGIVHLRVKAQPGDTIRLHPAELIMPDSSADQRASGKPFYFTYVASGAPEGEVWQPQFTYYGFRYVEVEGAVPAGKPNPDALPEVLEITGLHTRNSAAEAGTFASSSPLFNKVHTLIDWAIRSNLASVLTDCPHREKLGWLEQAYLMGPSIHYRYDLSRLYAKTVEDMRVAQTSEGMIPTITPHYVLFSDGFLDTPEWGSAYIIVPWYMYRWYGDLRLLESNYTSMGRYIDYLGSKATDHIISYGLGDWYDIGPGFPGYSQLTTNGVTATATYYHNVTIMEQVARLLGRESDAVSYGALASRIKTAFNKTYFDPVSKTYDRNSQTANAIVLTLGLVEPEHKAAIVQNLINDIRGRSNALTAGDVGYRYVLRALEQNGASELIYDMNSKYDVPGYGYQLALGATCLTESWQAYAGVSNNHCMLGHLMEWLYSGLGGISQTDASVAYKEVQIKPQVVGDVTDARASFASPYGLIRSEWKRTQGAFTLRVEVPANATALVYLPTTLTPDLRVTESGLPLANAPGVSGVADVASEPGYAIVRIGSGLYDFRVE